MTSPACFFVRSYTPISLPRMSAISFSRAAVDSRILLPIDSRYWTCLFVAGSSLWPFPLVEARRLLSGAAGRPLPLLLAALGSSSWVAMAAVLSARSICWARLLQPGRRSP